MNEKHAFPHDNPLRQRLQAAVCTRVGKDFLADMAFLADLLGYPLPEVARLLITGRATELAAAMGGMIGIPDLLSHQAKTFVLPDEYSADYDGLLRHLHRKAR